MREVINNATQMSIVFKTAVISSKLLVKRDKIS